MRWVQYDEQAHLDIPSDQIFYREDYVKERDPLMRESARKAIGGIFAAIVSGLSAYALFQSRHISLDASWRQLKVGGIWTGVVLLVILSLAGMINFWSGHQEVMNPEYLTKQLDKDGRVFVEINTSY